MVTEILLLQAINKPQIIFKYQLVNLIEYREI